MNYFSWAQTLDGRICYSRLSGRAQHSLHSADCLKFGGLRSKSVRRESLLLRYCHTRYYLLPRVLRLSSSTNCGKNIVWRQVAAKNNNLQILYQFLCIFLFLHATSVCNATDSAGWDFQLQPSQQPHIKKQTSNHSFKWAKATNNITGMFPHLIKASFDSGWFDRW